MVCPVTEKNKDAWAKMGMGKREKPEQVFPRFTQRSFDDLKQDYISKYGYTIRIPQIDDIIHLKPKASKTEVEIKAEKKANLVRLLDSPAPGWARSYTSAMTWIDDVQDTASVVYPLLHYAYKIAPKAFGKLLPLIGWLTTGYEILDILNALGRAPLSPMKAKRESCKFLKHNPMGLNRRMARIERIKNWKPNLSDFIQAAQVSDMLFGVGLSLGAMIGVVQDSIFGAYRYLSGDPVRFTIDPPDVSNLSRLGGRALTAAAAISSQGQTFSQTIHFWTYQTSMLSSILCAGNFIDSMLVDLVEDPMNMMLPAPAPSDPSTISIIQEQGLNVEEGTRWPFNGEKFISVGDFIDATVEPCRARSLDYIMRHSKDWYGWATAYALELMQPFTLTAIEPESEIFTDDTEEMKVFWRMVKAPLLPTGTMTNEQKGAFRDWILYFYRMNDKTPGILEIENYLEKNGIPYQTSYPAEPAPDFLKFWPAGWKGDESY